MIDVDFHILQDSSTDARWIYACRLIEKVSRLGHAILVTLDTQTDAERFDDLLWSFKPESFIPHHIIDAATMAKVEITYSEQAGKHNEILINLNSKIPDYHKRFKRVIEIVIQEPKVLESTREHYRIYKQQGYAITQHKR